MIKSFTESGGTTLSTDWSSIGKRKSLVCSFFVLFLDWYDEERAMFVLMCFYVFRNDTGETA